MKKLLQRSLSLLLALALAVVSLPMLAVSAETGDKFEYAVLTDGTVQITEYNGSDEAVVIPAKLHGYTVTSLGYAVFANDTVLRSVTLPEGLTSLGSSVFYGCASLESITLPASLVSIGNTAFYNCRALQSVSFSEGLTMLGARAFEFCTSLQSVTLPASLTEIGPSAFLNCISLQNVTLPAALETVKEETFSYCTSLKSITLPSSLKTLCYGAFYGCCSLETVTLPVSLTTVVEGAFEDCGGLRTVQYGGLESDRAAMVIGEYNEALTEAQWQYNTKVQKTEGDYTYEADTALGTATVLFYNGTDNLVTVPAVLGGYAVTGIGDGAFAYNYYLYEVTLPASVKHIGDEAFKNCSLLQSVYGLEAVTDIGRAAFAYCSVLRNITLPKGLTRLEADSFRECITLRSVTVPETVESIGSYAFFGCSTLSTLTLFKTLKTVENSAFEYCKQLQIVNYSGTETTRAAMAIGAENSTLERAVWRYNTVPTVKTYPDVRQKDWYYEAANYVTYYGFMSGYKTGKFGAADAMQRQDFVLILARVAGVDLTQYEGQNGGLTDVPKNAYYASAVAWGVENGIVTGYKTGKFGVGDPITREQVCTILYRYVGSPEVTNVDGTLAAFPDKAAISGFAKTAMAWAVQNGVMSGMGGGKMAPTAKASRAQVATIVMRMDQQALL